MFNTFPGQEPYIIIIIYQIYKIAPFLAFDIREPVQNSKYLQINKLELQKVIVGLFCSLLVKVMLAAGNKSKYNGTNAIKIIFPKPVFYKDCT